MAKKKKKNTNHKQKEIPRVRVPNFVKSYATNCHCGITNQDIRIEFTNEKIYDGKGWMLLIDSVVILTPVCAKKLLLRLQESITAYEEKQGVIPEELEEVVY